MKTLRFFAFLKLNYSPKKKLSPQSSGGDKKPNAPEDLYKSKNNLYAKMLQRWLLNKMFHKIPFSNSWKKVNKLIDVSDGWDCRRKESFYLLLLFFFLAIHMSGLCSCQMKKKKGTSQTFFGTLSIKWTFKGKRRLWESINETFNFVCLWYLCRKTIQQL